MNIIAKALLYFLAVILSVMVSAMVTVVVGPLEPEVVPWVIEAFAIIVFLGSLYPCYLLVSIMFGSLHRGNHE